MTDNYLARLNPEQRHAVEHGADQPLLIIAGAGSGKTDTLAHRVAHLIVRRADPRRMMLLTFSRRAAAEMSRRVERIAAQVLPEQGRLMVDALTWSGTFHAVGARLLREYSDQIGLDRAFTFMIAPTLPTSSIWSGTISGYRKPKSAFQLKILASRSTRELSMPRPHWPRCWLRIFPGARSGKASSKNYSAATSRPSNGRTCSIMMTFSSTGPK
jgi:hypothetical protein